MSNICDCCNNNILLLDRIERLLKRKNNEISNKLIEYLNNENVAWETKFTITNYFKFRNYYEGIIGECKGQYGSYDNLLKWKGSIRKRFESSNDLLDVYVKIFSDVKYHGKDINEFWLSEYKGGKNLLCILCFVYSRYCLHKKEKKEK